MTGFQDLRGRHALVCGASAGIGRASACAIAARGARVTVLARRLEQLESLLPELLEAGAESAQALRADLDQREELVGIVDALLAEHGAVHVLINNAGGPASGPMAEAEEEHFLAAFGRHVLGSHALLRRCLPGMREAGFGRVVNIISTSVREPIAGLGVSNTVRGAMASWAKTWSKELPPGVTINNVLPGFTDTERLGALKQQMAERRGVEQDEVEAGWLGAVPEGRLGKPEELAALVGFLVSPSAAYIRGQSIAVDGGRLNSI